MTLNGPLVTIFNLIMSPNHVIVARTCWKKSTQAKTQIFLSTYHKFTFSVDSVDKEVISHLSATTTWFGDIMRSKIVKNGPFKVIQAVLNSTL